MRLVASLIVKDEMHRYLKPCIRSLQAYCDEIRVWDDGSSDGSFEWLQEQRLVQIGGTTDSRFFEHEGGARQQLLQWTIQAEPTHVLAIDADEFVADGAHLRRTLESYPDVAAYGLCMQEVWKAEEQLSIRMDGGWVPHEVAGVWKMPIRMVGPDWTIRDQALACGRVPAAVEHAAARLQGASTGTDILHFGWARESERQARYDRYVTHDGGNFHAGSHLDSIMWEDDRVQLCERDWPDSLLGLRMMMQGAIG